MSNTAKISIRALLFGVVADVGGTILTSKLFFLFLGMMAAMRVHLDGTPLQGGLQGPAAWYSLLVGHLIVGLSFTFLGGFLAARSAGRSRLLHSAIVGVASVVISVAMMHGVHGWFDAVGLALLLPSALLGGFVARPPRIHR